MDRDEAIRLLTGGSGVWQRFETKWATRSARPSHRRSRKGGFHTGSQIERVVRGRAVPVENQRGLAEPVDVLREVQAEP